MKNNKLIYLVIISLFIVNCFAQKTNVNVSDKKNDKYVYIDVIKTYERVAEKGYKSADMFLKMANAFYFKSEFDKAAKWYGELFAMTLDLEPIYYYRYAYSLKFIGQNDTANEILEKLKQKSEAIAVEKIEKKR